MMAVWIVKAVAERDYGVGLELVDRGRQCQQRLTCIVGRQQLAAPREMRALLQMHVGNDQDAFARPEKRPGLIRDQVPAADADPLGVVVAETESFRFEFQQHCSRYPVSNLRITYGAVRAPDQATTISEVSSARLPSVR
jgi:hypothetical protein